MTTRGKSVDVMAEGGDQVAVADVYGGDAGAQWLDEGGGTIFLFVIEADPEPDVLARVAMIFNLANVAPLNANFQRKSEGNATIAVSIPLLGDVQADLIRRKLEQLTCTLSVSLSEAS
jgi:hypothetical protein